MTRIGKINVRINDIDISQYVKSITALDNSAFDSSYIINLKADNLSALVESLQNVLRYPKHITLSVGFTGNGMVQLSGEVAYMDGSTKDFASERVEHSPEWMTIYTEDDLHIPDGFFTWGDLPARFRLDD